MFDTSVHMSEIAKIKITGFFQRGKSKLLIAMMFDKAQGSMLFFPDIMALNQ